MGAGIGAVFTEMGGAGFVALFLGAGLHELVLWKDDATKDAGDFGDPFNFAKSISVERNYELNNGRMAMFAVVGELVAQLVSGKDAVEQFGLKGGTFLLFFDAVCIRLVVRVCSLN